MFPLLSTQVSAGDIEQQLSLIYETNQKFNKILLKSEKRNIMETKVSFDIFRDPVPSVPFGSISTQTDITWDSSKEVFTNGECKITELPD